MKRLVAVWLLALGAWAEAGETRPWVLACHHDHGVPLADCEQLAPPRSPFMQTCWQSVGEARWQCPAIVERVRAVREQVATLGASRAMILEAVPVLGASTEPVCEALPAGVMCVFTERDGRHRLMWADARGGVAPVAGALPAREVVDYVRYSPRYDRLAAKTSRAGVERLAVYAVSQVGPLVLTLVSQVVCDKGMVAQSLDRLLAYTQGPLPRVCAAGRGPRAGV